MLYIHHMEPNALVQTLAASVLEAILILDLSGRFVHCNHQAAMILGQLQPGQDIRLIMPGLDTSQEGVFQTSAQGKSLLCTLKKLDKFLLLSFSTPQEDIEPGQETSGKRMEDLHAASIKLAEARSQVELYRLAVELARARLGMARAAIYLHDPDMNEICGTWSVDELGMTRDESMFRSPLSSDEGDIFKRLKASHLVSGWEDGENRSQAGPDGHGWDRIVTLWDGNNVAGWFAASATGTDSLKSPVDQELLLAYARTISSLITNKRHEEDLEAAVAMKTLELQRSENHFRELSETLQHQKEEIERLFTIMAHDLRGPLGSLRNLILTATEHPDLIGPEEMIELLPDMTESVEATYSLLENLLDWVRSQMKEITVLMEWRKVEEIFAHLHQWLDRIAQNKGIKITARADSNLLVFADQRMLETILRNLVSNALKFSPRDTEVELRAFRDQDREMLVFEVEDHGLGMYPEQVAGLFAMKGRKVHRGTAGEKGSGLGLMFSQDLAKRMGGSISVMSEPGKGSIFTLSVPEVIEDELPPA